MPVDITDDIPVPKRRRRGPTALKWPWNTLEVGQSFAMPDIGIQSARVQASVAGKAYGRRFSVALHDGVPRVWRVG